MIALEFLIMVAKGKNKHTIFYTFTNITGGVFEQFFNKLCIKPFFFLLYCYLYEYYKICELPWESVWTWYTVFLTVDFFYYWFHRASHGMLTPSIKFFDINNFLPKFFVTVILMILRNILVRVPTGPGKSLKVLEFSLLIICQKSWKSPGI